MKSNHRYNVHPLLREAVRLGLGHWLPAVCLAVSSWAGSAQAALPDQLAACRAIANDPERLVCYDALTQAAAGVPAAPDKLVVTSPPTMAAPATTPVTPAVPAVSSSIAKAQQGFGAETFSKSDEEAPQYLQAHLVGSIDGFKRGAVLHLDNGQIWESIDDREYYYEGDSPAITIERNFAGNYWMHVEHGSFNLRVSRVQ